MKFTIHSFLLSIQLLLLVGCVTNIKVIPKYQGGTIEVTDGKAPLSNIEAKAVESCKSRNMKFLRLENFDEGKLFDNTVFGAYLYNFYCDSIQDDKNSNQSNSIKLEQQKSSVKKVPAPQTDKLSIDQAKIHCAELGFKPGSERFAECILELSK